MVLAPRSHRTYLTGSRRRTALAKPKAKFGPHENVCTTEQTVLVSAVTAYMNLLRDTAIFELQRSNLDVLQEQLRQTKQRLESGNVTATDVYQSELRLSVGRTQLFAAEANYRTSRAVYRQVIGVEPGRLMPASAVDRFIPDSLPAAVTAGTAEHPTVATAQYNVDVALYQVKVAEGALYPTLSLLGSVQRNYDLGLTTPRISPRQSVANFLFPFIKAARSIRRSGKPKRRSGNGVMILM